MSPAGRRLVARCATLVVSTATALLIAEGALRLVYPGHAFVTGRERERWGQGGEARRIFSAHDELGYVPILGGDHYGAFGTLNNDYAVEKPPGTTRLLFMGDSVTARHRLIDGLRALYGEESFEYWNAGVDGYNTFQEVELYKRWNAGIQPDHVILTFHNNDFEATPVTFMDDDDELVVYAPRFPLRGVDPWLFGSSHLYRLLVARLSDAQEGAGKAEQTTRTLRELRDLLAEQGVRFSVVVFPVLQPLEEWTPRQQKSRTRILRIVEELDLHAIDLLTPLEELLAEGLELSERPGDMFHPNDRAAGRFAAYLQLQGLLDADSGRLR